MIGIYSQYDPFNITIYKLTQLIYLININSVFSRVLWGPFEDILSLLPYSWVDELVKCHFSFIIFSSTFSNLFPCLSVLVFFALVTLSVLALVMAHNSELWWQLKETMFKIFGHKILCEIFRLIKFSFCSVIFLGKLSLNFWNNLFWRLCFQLSLL